MASPKIAQDLLREKDLMQEKIKQRRIPTLIVEAAADSVVSKVLTSDEAAKIAEEGYRRLLADKVPERIATKYRIRTIQHLTSPISW